MCKILDAKLWTVTNNAFLQCIQQGVKTRNRITGHVTEWNSLDLRVRNLDVLKGKANYEGIGISTFQGSTIPYTVDIIIDKYQAVIKKTHSSVIYRNTVFYKVDLLDPHLTLKSKVSIGRLLE
jgi:hypothetical protein